MVHLPQFILSLLSLTYGPWAESTLSPVIGQKELAAPLLSEHQNITKSIAIVGAGSAGLAILKTLLDLPEEVRCTWHIVLYEQRRDVGGVWLADPAEPHPPALPETPLYPLLHTNTPHPTMTYPGFTFRPNTPLFPSWEYLQRYHVDFAEHLNLTSYIRLNHTVVAAGWHGNATSGKWEIEVTRSDRPSPGSEHEFFDHLIVGNGHNHYPRIPHWDGEEHWLENTPMGKPKREILHSIFYREPERYANRTVLIVGGGASGRDAALQVGSLTTTYQSLHEGSAPPEGANVTVLPPILRFISDSVVFTDGSSISSIDSLILATGYQSLVPFLSRIPSNSNLRSPALVTDAQTQANSTTARSLTTNTRYIFPLYEDIFSLSPQLPPTALSFVGLPVLIANCPSDIAQSLFITHAIVDPSILPSRTKMLQALVRREESRRTQGFDPYYVGHKMIGGDHEAQDYQDKLVHYLKERGKLPNDGKPYVEEWRRTGRRDSRLLARAWARVEKEGAQEKWLDGVETEEQWADLMKRLTVWQEEWETPDTVLLQP
ncbi:FAD/NAD-P-binding domain-containing protein [Cytidiella melzeri]|nr:FAD/NAD-P-binding domain-containing protein [Cytidiella melzeri]